MNTSMLYSRMFDVALQSVFTSKSLAEVLKEVSLLIPTYAYYLVSEITVIRCMFASQWADMCAPKSSKEDDAIKGKWVRVEPDLNIQAGMWHLVSLRHIF